MAIPPFRGNSLALSSDGLAAVTSSLGIHAEEIWTVVHVETAGCGFISDGRPEILYERHIFHRLTNGKFDDGDISAIKPGGYGSPGSHQYDRLAAAIAKAPGDPNVRAAALKSASWGIGQIMGENFSAAGFADVETMVSAMSDSEDKQLAAMGKLLASSRLDSPLRAHDWGSFARGYNGPNFAINRYDVKLNAEFQKCVAGGLPDVNARAAQLYLTYLGFHPGKIDGIAGEMTLAALADFQANKGLPATTIVDDQVVAALRASVAAAFNGAGR
jgi:N-acetylmuramidase/Putative peptidoglycan binding domain